MREREGILRKKEAVLAQKPHLLNQIWEEDTKYGPSESPQTARIFAFLLLQKARRRRKELRLLDGSNGRNFFQDNAIAVRKLAATILHPVD